jgi:hypothetical protein
VTSIVPARAGGQLAPEPPLLLELLLELLPDPMAQAHCQLPLMQSSAGT